MYQEKVEKIFNNKLNQYKKQNPNATVTHLLLYILEYSETPSNNFITIKNLADRVGLGFGIKESKDRRSKFIPYLEYKGDGLLKKHINNSNVEDLVCESTPMTYKGAVELLAKEVLYKLSEVEGIKDIVSDA